MEYFRLVIVETAGIPGLVISARAFVEVLIERAVEPGETFQFVLGRVGMDEIHDHADPEPMSFAQPSSAVTASEANLAGQVGRGAQLPAASSAPDAAPRLLPT